MKNYCIARLLLAAISASLCLSACKNPEAAGKSAQGGGAAGGGDKKSGASRSFPVGTETVQTREVTYQIEAIGALIEENRFDIPARVAGVAQRVSFAEGDYVTTGQELARVDYDRYQLQVDRARSTVNEKEATVRRAEANLVDAQRETSSAVTTAKLNLELAENEFRRRAATGTGNFTSGEERGQSEAKYRQAQTVFFDASAAANTRAALALAELNEERTALTTAQADLSIAQDDLNRSIIAAPIAGTIQQRKVVDGQYLMTGTTVALMVQGDPLRLRFTVPESRAAKLSRDMEVSFTVPAYPGRTFAGRVYDVGAFANESREIVCWASVPNSQGELKPGYFSKVSLLTDSKSAAVVVPLASVQPTEKGMVAYVVQDGNAIRKPVLPGLQVTGDAIEILEGLEPGEQLVVEGMGSLQDNVPVKIVNAAKSINAKPETTVTGAVVSEPQPPVQTVRQNVGTSAVESSKVGA